MKKSDKKKSKIIITKESQTRLLLLAALFFSSLFIFRSYLFGDRRGYLAAVHHALCFHCKSSPCRYVLAVGFYEWNGNEYVSVKSV